MKYFKSLALSAVAALLLAACGGGGSDTTPRANITSVKVMGDSLADVGTFGGIKFTHIPAVADSFKQLGFALSLAPTIGITELACVAVYVIPRTSILGAILLTGFLGGAIAAHVRPLSLDSVVKS